MLESGSCLFSDWKVLFMHEGLIIKLIIVYAALVLVYKQIISLYNSTPSSLILISYHILIVCSSVLHSLTAFFGLAVGRFWWSLSRQSYFDFGRVVCVSIIDDLISVIELFFVRVFEGYPREYKGYFAFSGLFPFKVLVFWTLVSSNRIALWDLQVWSHFTHSDKLKWSHKMSCLFSVSILSHKVIHPGCQATLCHSMSSSSLVVDGLHSSLFDVYYGEFS